MAPDVGEADALRFELLVLLLLEVGQAEILEDQRRQVLQIDLSFVVIVAGLVAGLALPRSVVIAGAADNVADLRAALALADAVLLVGIERNLYSSSERIGTLTTVLPSERMMSSRLTISCRFCLIASLIFSLWRCWSMCPLRCSVQSARETDMVATEITLL